jgi:hypothetical protein
VYVVDSASSDGTAAAVADAFPQVKLTASAENLGFAGGNNFAFGQMGFDDSIIVDPDALPRAVYLLNPDTITQSGATSTLFDALMSLPEAGVVGAQLSYEDGSFQHSGFKFPGLRQLWVEFFPTPGRLLDAPFNGRYERTKYQSGQPFEIDFPLGATMMLKREVILQTGVFDPEFFMYCEETDWAWRIRKAGWKIYCVPTAHVIHLSAKSTSQVKPRSIIDLWTSRLRLFRKHYPAWKLTLAHWMIRIGMRRKADQARRQGDEQVAEAYEQIQKIVRGS